MLLKFSLNYFNGFNLVSFTMKLLILDSCFTVTLIPSGQEE